MAVTTTQVQQLYLAYFGRPAEQAGLTYWTAQTNANVTDISAAFAQSAEYTGVYGSLTRAQTVDTLYQNLFGRSAASNELNYWVNSTDVSVSNLALALVNGATGTDRLLLDTKAQYAATVTTNAGAAGTANGVASTYTGTQVGGQTLATYLAASNNNTANGFYNAANAAAKASVTPTVTTAAQTLDFKGLSAGTATLNGLNGTAAAQTLANTSVVTDLTLKGTIAGTSSVTLAEAPTSGTDLVTTLHLNVSSSATTGTPALTVVATDATTAANSLSALTTIDGASSSAGLVLNTTALDNLSSVTTGSGNDTVTVDTINTAAPAKAVALSVDTGAGNDTIVGSVGTANLTINAGAGNDTITVNAGSANLVVNAGAGNDTVTLGASGTVANTVTASHTSVITLGDGNDVVSFSQVVNNIQNYSATNSSSTAAQVTAADTALKAGLISVSDFNVATDTLAFAAVTAGSATTANTVATLTNAQIGAISAASSLSAAVQLAAGDLGGKAGVAFQYGSDTYVFVEGSNSGNVAGTVDNGDALIQLTGVTATQLTAANFTHA